MKYFCFFLVALLIASCTNKEKEARTAAFQDSLNAVKSIRTADSTGIHVLDSLEKQTVYGELQSLHFRGEIDYPSGHQSECNILLYIYENKTNGVYVMTFRDLKTGRKSVEKGHAITMQSNEINIYTQLYQFHPFNSSRILEFFYKDDCLQFISKTSNASGQTGSNILTLQNPMPDKHPKRRRPDPKSVWR